MEPEIFCSLSSNSSSLQLLDLRDGSIIADMAVDLSTIGQVSSLHWVIGVILLRCLEQPASEIALRRRTQKVTVSGNADIDGVLFGIGVDGANTAPVMTAAPIFTTQEDRGFLRLAPAALAHSAMPKPTNTSLFSVVLPGMVLRSSASMACSVIHHTPISWL